ncbi:MAG: contractile injection system tape measure protein [Gammaproteobacteria bacterium]
MNSIIRHFIIEAEMAGTESESIALQQTLARLTHDRIIPEVSTVVERCAPDRRHWYFERLSIDVGAFDFECLESDLASNIADCLERSLQDRLETWPAPFYDDTEAVRIHSFSVAVEQAWLFFLACGRLPWSFAIGAGQTLESVVLTRWREGDSADEPESAKHADFNRTVIELLASPLVRFRLFNQFSRHFLETLLQHLSAGAKSVLDQVTGKLYELEAPDKNKEEFYTRLMETVFEALATHQTMEADVLIRTCWNDFKKALPDLDRRLWLVWLSSHWSFGAEVLDDSEPDTGGTAEPKRGVFADRKRHFSSVVERLTATANAELGEGIFIANAGLILLHPFLPQLFQTLAVADHERLLKPERALMLLHYLTTGQTAAPEYELVLPKLLCNIPLATPVESLKELHADERQEADALLDAVVRHWAALGEASRDSLRGTFLLRPGKVSMRKDGDWLLQVESRSFDILLNRLPWGISMLKLPWMQQLLWVEWCYESEF